MMVRLVPFLICALFIFPVSSVAEMRSPLDVARQLGMSDAEIENVRKGNVGVEELEASSDKDLSIALIARLDAPVAKVDAFLKSDRLVEISTVTKSTGQIDPSNFSIDALDLPAESIARLMDDPEGAFYLSKDEASQVAKAAKQGKAQALAAYKKVLSARARAYWEKGLAGITPYAGDGRSPKVDLEHANEAAKDLVHNDMVRAALASVPAKNSSAVTQSLSWSVQEGREVAAPVLDHRILFSDEGGEVSILRRFYSGYDYDAMQIVTGILPVDDGKASVAFYLNRTYTSQVAGFGGGAKRSIGRKLMQKELIAELERAQAAIKK